MKKGNVWEIILGIAAVVTFVYIILIMPLIGLLISGRPFPT